MTELWKMDSIVKQQNTSGIQYTNTILGTFNSPSVNQSEKSKNVNVFLDTLHESLLTLNLQIFFISVRDNPHKVFLFHGKVKNEDSKVRFLLPKFSCHHLGQAKKFTSLCSSFLTRKMRMN